MHMKVWIIGRAYPTPANRMRGLFELEQAKLLARNGCDVSYIALTLGLFSRKDPRGMRSFEEDGVKVYIYSHFYFSEKMGFRWGKYEDRCWKKLFYEAENANGEPEIIHIHYPSALSCENEICEYKKKNIKVIVTEHWSNVMIQALKEREMARIKYYANNADCFICVSKLLRDAVLQQTNVTVPMEVIPNIVSPVFFERLSFMKTKKRENEFVFICVGRLIPIKQFDIVIKQFIKNFANNKNVILKIIGDGPEKMNLYKAIDGKARIVFTGSIPLEEVAYEIKNADVLISFSKYETFAVPVAEAWACGKPAILTDKSGIVSYVQDNLGIAVQSNSPNELGSAMLYTYEHYDRYNPDEISSFAKEQFSDIVVAKKLMALYQSKE